MDDMEKKVASGFTWISENWRSVVVGCFMVLVLFFMTSLGNRISDLEPNVSAIETKISAVEKDASAIKKDVAAIKESVVY